MLSSSSSVLVWTKSFWLGVLIVLCSKGCHGFQSVLLKTTGAFVHAPPISTTTSTTTNVRDGTVVASPFSNTMGSLSTTKTTALHMIFERMSEQCIGALVTAQNEASRLGQDSVGNELMTVGVVDSPENARSTLQKYGITFRKVKQTVSEKMFAPEESSNNSAGNNGQAFANMFNRQQKARNVELPFTRELKRTLTAAERWADKFDSPEIRSEHVLLSLLKYEEDADTGQITAATVDPETDTAVGALAVFMLTDDLYLDSSTSTSPVFSASQFCRELTLAMLEEGGKQELVGAGGKGGKDTTPTLTECGVDLTEEARQNQLDPVYGRDEEIAMALRTLVRRRKNNPCLIGEPGVGKTAIAEGLAQIMAAPDMLATAKSTMDRDEDGNLSPADQDTYARLSTLARSCPPRLAGHRVISLELATLVAGTKYRGEFEERLQTILQELTSDDAPPTILFLDEIHTLVGAGAAEGGIDAANTLKPALARGKLRVVGATTISEYRQHVEKDAALERRLRPILIKEPTAERATSIVRAVAPKYARHHAVEYTDAALDACVKLGERYVMDRFLPDKAIDLLDEAGAAVLMESVFSGSVDDSNTTTPIVTEHDVAAVVSQWTNIPIGKLEQEESLRLMNIQDELELRVKGQNRAIQSVARAVKRARSGLRDTTKPVASFLFAGPTGVGKTELCKTLAESYFGSEKDMIRMDMSEYMEKHSVSRLVGPPPGYVGYQEGGQLTEAVRRAPHSVVLLDEVEKGHPDVLNILLQIMEDGILTDGKGRTVDFKNVILVMTSNVGSKQILQVVNKRKRGSSSSSSSSSISSTSSSSSPPRPQDVLKRLQASPEAMALMMEASRDQEIMTAMQTAMGGSPADLMRIAQGSPKVADFLTRLWGALDMNDDNGNGDDYYNEANEATTNGIVNGNTNNNNNNNDDDPILNGLNSVRSSLDNWAKSSDNSFASGLAQQLQGMINGNNNDDQVNGNTDTPSPSSPSSDTTVKDALLYSEMSSVVKEELEDSFKPELLNRIDEIIVFAPLGGKDLLDIGRNICQQTVNRAEQERDVSVQIKSRLLQKIVREGSFDATQFGARPMRRAVQRHFEDTLSEAIVQGFITEGDEVTAELDENEDSLVCITRKRDGKSITVAVEDAGGGIGMPTSTEAWEDQPNGLNTESVTL